MEKEIMQPKLVVLTAKVPTHDKKDQFFAIGFTQTSDDDSLTKLIEAFEIIQQSDQFMELLQNHYSEYAFNEDVGKIRNALKKFGESVKHLSIYMKYKENTLFYDEYIAKLRLSK